MLEQLINGVICSIEHGVLTAGGPVFENIHLIDLEKVIGLSIRLVMKTDPEYESVINFTASELGPDSEKVIYDRVIQRLEQFLDQQGFADKEFSIQPAGSDLCLKMEL